MKISLTGYMDRFPRVRGQIKQLILNPFLASVQILNPPENTRKHLVFWCFQGGLKWELDRNGFNNLQDSSF